ncbi:hypothetical protein HGA89_04320, partial [bacterium]|nr:hypothetical protein [bacterium]
FCPFSPPEVAAAETAGLRHYVWWQNGVYTLPALSESVKALGLGGGAPQVAWGWYGADWKSGEGPVTSAQTLADLTTTVFEHPLRVSNGALRASLGVARMHQRMEDLASPGSCTFSRSTTAADRLPR